MVITIVLLFLERDFQEVRLKTKSIASGPPRVLQRIELAWQLLRFAAIYHQLQPANMSSAALCTIRMHSNSTFQQPAVGQLIAMAEFQDFAPGNFDVNTRVIMSQPTAQDVNVNLAFTLLTNQRQAGLLSLITLPFLILYSWLLLVRPLHPTSPESPNLCPCV